MNEEELVERPDRMCSCEVGYDAKGDRPRVKSVKLRFDAETNVPDLRAKAVKVVEAAMAAAESYGRPLKEE